MSRDPAEAVDFRVLFEATPGALLVLCPDAQFTIVAANDEYLRAARMTREELVGRGVLELFPDSSRAHDLRNSLATVLRERTANEIPSRPYTAAQPNGQSEVRYLRVVNSPVRDERGEIILIVHHAEDVTEHVQLERRAFAILDSITDAFLSVDREFRVTYVNREARRFFGMVDGEYIGRSLWEAAPGWRSSRFEHEYRTALETQHVAHFEASAVETCFEVHAYPSPEGLAIYFCDITDRKRTEARLRTLESVVTTANDAVIITEAEPLDEPGPRIVYVNDGFTRMTGYTSDEVLGRSPRFMQGPGTSAAARAAMRAALERRESVRVELVNYRKDGAPFWVDIAIAPVFDETGRIVHFTSVQRDTTDRKRAESDAIGLAREQAAREQAEIGRAEVTAILESIRDAFFAIDREYRFTYVNRRAEQLFGRSGEHLIGRSLWDEFPAASETRFGREYQLAMLEGRDRSFEQHVPSIDRWLAVHVFPSSTGLSVYLHDVTERRRVEASLRESERRYRELVDNSMDAVLLTTPDGRIAMANDAATKLLGYTEDELRTLNRLDLKDPNDPRVADASEQRRRTGRFRGELYLRRKDGSCFPAEISSAQYRHDEGAEWTSLFIRDVTDRKREELERERLVAQLDAERGWLRSVIDTVPMGLLLHGPFGHIDFNRRARELFGITQTESSGLHIANRVLYPDGSAVPPEQMVSARVLRTGESVMGAEFILETKEATRTPVIGSAAPIRDGEGRLVGAICVFQDVTERMRAAEAIRASERLLSGLFELLPVGLWVTDHEGRVLRANRAAARVRAGRVPDPGNSAEWGLQGALRGETRVGEIVRVARPDGGAKIIRHSALPLQNDHGQFVAAILLDEDVTGLKETEEALRRAVGARDDVLAVVAHDLRSPLTAIMMQSQILERSVGEPRVRTLVESMRRNALRMNRLIEDLLDVSRIERGALAIRPTAVRADALLAEVVETERPIAARTSIELLLDVRGAPVTIWADHERLVQVLENLVSNAIKFTGRRGRIVVGAAPRGRDCLFWVADTGPGIASDALPHLFDRFWQADRDDRRGAGLGLAIAKGIVEQHGGRVWADSTVGRGTTLFFTIPLATSVDAFAHDTAPR